MSNLCCNIFGHSFECENYSNILIIFRANMYLDICSCQIFVTNKFRPSFVYFFICIYIWTFVRVKTFTNVTL